MKNILGFMIRILGFAYTRYYSAYKLLIFPFYHFQESMQTYQDMGDNYEPSADELIDVLKNLENLAAINPALYRAIVDQIKSKITYRKKKLF